MLAINIEDDTIRLTSFKGRKISFCAEVPLMAGWVQNGVIIDRLAVGQQIIKTVVDNRISNKDVSVCVSATHSIYRVVFVPRLDRALMAEAARKEMERVCPVPLDTLYTSWQDIKTSDVEVGLCLLGLPHDNVDSVIDTITIAGLRLKSLELKPLAVSRVIDEATAIVLNLQSNGFDITIIDKGVPELIRSLTFPQVDMPDTEKMVVIKEELLRTVNFHNSSRTERQLGNSTACFISGQMQGIATQDIGYVVRPLPELMTYPAWVDTGRFAANTGLILKETGDKSGLMKVEIDVMPRVVEPAQVVAARSGMVPLIALIIGVLIIIVVYILSSTADTGINDLQSKINQQQKLITDTQASITQQKNEGAGQLDQYRQQLISLKEPLDALAQQRAYSERDLGTVTGMLPAIMYLTSIIDDGSSIVLEGSAPSSEMILDYASDLRQSSNFSNVRLTSMENLSYSNFKFIINLLP